MKDKTLLGIRQSAEFLEVSMETLRRWDNEGKFLSIRIGSTNHRKYRIEELKKFKDGELKKIDLNFPTTIYADRLIDFHSPAVENAVYFARIIHAIAEKVDKMIDCEIIDGPYDKNRDIIGYEITRYNKKSLVYIQCKHVKDITKDLLIEEVDGLHNHISHQTIDKPKKIIFALSTNINATLRDEIRTYANQILGISKSNIIFWCPNELDSKIKSCPEILNKFILSGNLNNPTLQDIDDKSDEPKYENIKAILTRSSQLIQNNQFQEAEEKLHLLIGSLPKSDNYQKEKAKIYNNLGLCYKWKVENNTQHDYSKPIEAFNKAIDYDPTFWKAHCNLINTLLLTNNKENDEVAWNSIHKIWEEVGPLDELILITYLQTYSIKFGKQKAIEEAKTIAKFLKDEGKENLTENTSFWHFMASTYFFVNKFEKSKKYISKALKYNQYDVDAIYMKAMIKMKLATEDSEITKDFLENFKNINEIKEIESLLKEAYELALESKRYDLIPEIYHNRDLCRLWLWKTTGEKLKKLNYPLAEDTKIDKNQTAKIPECLLNKDYEGAFSVYKQLVTENNDFPYKAKFNTAWIFYEYGYPEISLKILQDTELDPNIKFSYKHWLFKSRCQVLVGNKSLAVESANTARSLVKENSDELKEILAYRGALFLRFQKEGDRLLQTALEYNSLFPEDKTLTTLNIEKKEDKDFIINSMTEHKRWYENILEIYKNNPIPVYFLENTFKRPFVELWASRGADFPWEYHSPNNKHPEHIEKLLDKHDVIIADYIGLLTLVKANLIGFVERTGKRVVVHRKTYNKIQEELLQHENATLRKLWDLLRKSTYFELIDFNETLTGDLKKLSNTVDSWLLHSIQLAKNNNYLFLTDDLRLSKVINNEGVDVINSLAFLLHASAQKWIEKKDYSQMLGDIADCIYNFLPFNHEDLNEIIWQDEYKLTRRSYHLIHQIFLPTSNIISFIEVFNDFIVNLWKSGAISDDKIAWLNYISDEIGQLFNEWEKEKKIVTDEMKEFLDKFAHMWAGAIISGNLEDLKALKKELISVNKDSFMYKIKDNLLKHIELRLSELSPNS